MEEMILAGRITVNRMPAEVGQKVGPGDEVRINGELVKVRFTEPRARVLMYHKPSGELVTRDDPEGRPTVFEKLPSIGNGKWINIGRLDYNTEGLLLFTNSGELANRMMHPRFEVEREYAVRVMGRLTDEQVAQLTSGIELEDGLAKCERVEDGGGDDDGANHWYKVVLREGRNREVRRLFEALGLMVSRLIRTRYGSVAMPTVLKRCDLIELEPGAVGAVLAAAGLKGGAPQASSGGQPRDGRGPGRNKGPRPQGRPQGDRHGPRAAHPQGGEPRGGESRGGESRGGEPRGGEPRGGEPRGGESRGGEPRGGGHGRPHGRPGKPFHKGPRPQADGNVGTHPGNVDVNANADAQETIPVHEYDERQPLSNANAFPFGNVSSSGGGRGRPPGRGFGAQGGRPAGGGIGRPQGHGNRAPGQGPMQGPRGQGNGRPKGAGPRPQDRRPHGNGPRPQQDGRPQGNGPRPPQDGRPHDPTAGPRKRNRRRGNRARGTGQQPAMEGLPRDEPVRVDDES
jgi:23S rRNA pseudouridine2605 synthase